MKRTMKSSLVLGVALMLSLVTLTAAQSEQKRGWAARVAAAKAQRQAEREAGNTARTDDTQRRTTTDSAAENEAEAQNELFSWQQRPEPLVGTWYINIAKSNGGLPPFNALHNFHDGGTFTESSDLLVTQTEGPAFGVWKGRGARYHLTFQLFVFDPEKKEAAGMVRVRATIRMIGHDEFIADSVVDFIALDGTIEKGIDGGPFYGKRIKVLPAH